MKKAPSGHLIPENAADWRKVLDDAGLQHIPNPTNYPMEETVNTAGQKLLEAIQEKGSDARDLRDAAHEAHHALFTGLKPKWTRDRIHTAIVKRAGRAGRGLKNGELVAFELDARAVEWTVCERYGITYEPEKWADITWWETIKNMHIQCPSVEWILDAVKARKERKSIERYVDAVIALAPEPVKGISSNNIVDTLTLNEIQAVETGDTAPRCKQCGHPRKGHNYRHTFKADR